MLIVVGIGTTTPDTKLHVFKATAGSITDYSNNALIVENSGDVGISFHTPNANAGHLMFGSPGHQYHSYIRGQYGASTTSTLKFFTDQINTMTHKAGKVGIGTASPSSILHIEGNTNEYASAPILYFGSTSTANAAVRDWAIGPADDNYGNFHIFRGTSTGSDPIGNDGRVFTISSSGNVLVGKNATTFSTEGIVVFSSADSNGSRINITNDGGGTLNLNRKTSDGDIAIFYKDSTTVGSIGTEGTDLTIGSGGAGFQFLESENKIRPFNMSTNSASNGVVDLGRSNAKFKDLYLSGAIKMDSDLDDYEEGTWTPGLNDSGAGITNTGGTTYNWYVKVGKVVHLSANIAFSAADNSGNAIRISGLPFNTGSATAVAGSMISRYAGSVGTIAPYITGNNIYFYLQNSSSNWRIIAYNDVGQFEMHLSITYQTT